MPGDVEYKAVGGKEFNIGLYIADSVDTVVFTTDLDLDLVSHLHANNLTVREGDSNYQSMEGAIYSKDGSTLVRVPANRKEFTPVSSCTTFPLESVLYSDYMEKEIRYGYACDNLRKITIPASVQVVTFEETDWAKSPLKKPFHIKEVLVENPDLDEESIRNLKEGFSIIEEQIGSEISEESLPQDEKEGTSKKWVEKGITCQLKNGTLTVSGKGKLEKSFEYNLKIKKEIKKVIIKEGITSIPIHAFYECPNLEQVEIANTVNEIGQDAFSCCGNLKLITMPGKFTMIPYQDNDMSGSLGIATDVDTVAFTSDLDLDIVVHLGAKNLEVSKNDTNYKSIDGAVYKKKDTELMRILAHRTDFETDSSCTVVRLEAFLYNGKAYGEDALNYYACENLKKIVFSENVTKIIFTQDAWAEADQTGITSYLDVQKISLKNKELDKDSIDALTRAFPIFSEDYFTDQMDDSYVDEDLSDETDAVYVNNTLLRYTGTEEEYTVPEGTTAIAENAFNDNEYANEGVKTLKKIILPSSLETIGDNAFSGCSSLEEVTIKGVLRNYLNETFCYNNSFEVTPYDYYQEDLTLICEGSIAYGYLPCDINWRDSKAIFGESSTTYDIVPVMANVEKIGGYEVVVSTDETFTENVQNYQLESDPSSHKIYYTVDGVNKEHKLYIKIRAYQEIDGQTVYSQWQSFENEVIAW